MTFRETERRRQLACTILFVLVSSRMARATVDMTGRWLVTTQESFGKHAATIWDITQTGTTVTYASATKTETGDVDLASGAVSFPPPPPLPPGIPCNSDSGLTLQVAPDGESFTGSASVTSTFFDPNGNFGCAYNIITFTGGRCSDSTGTGECLMLSGGGSPFTDCLHEWITPRGAVLDTTGRQYPRLVCTHGDPTCDFDRNPSACTFYLGMCFNISDAGLRCSAHDVATVRFTPRGSAQLEQALANLGGRTQGTCFYRSTPCTVDPDCDTSRGKGICQQVISFPTALSDAQVCTPLTKLLVPVGGRRHRVTLNVRTKAASTRNVQDNDRLTLICN